MTEEEEFFAWLDGELEGEAAARFAARVAADPSLGAEAARHRGLASSLRDAFNPLLKGGDKPPRFEQAEVIDFGRAAAGRNRGRGWFAVPQWAAMAATLALGVFAGSMIGGQTDSPIAQRDGQLVAAASLERSLDAQLASNNGSSIRIGLTFRDGRGAVCRSFSGEAGSGLACRRAGEWQLAGLFANPEGQTSDYRMAAGSDPRLAALIDATIAGEPFDATQERAARDRHWR